MRIWVCFGAVLVGGFLALSQMGVAPELRAGWYSMLMTAVGLIMCWGGVEAARWLLRDSPVAQAATPRSDWGRLWLWSGIPSGALMLFWLLLGACLNSHVSRPVMVVLVALAIMGPAVWCIAGFWLAGEVVGNGNLKRHLVALLGGGMLLHLLGGLVAAYIFPHFVGMHLRSVCVLLSALSGYYPLAFCHLLLIGCVWSALFKVGIGQRFLSE